MTDWTIGKIYTFPTREMCVKNAAYAKEYFGGLVEVVFLSNYVNFQFYLRDPFMEG
jgi:hypothetical protein